MEAKLKILVIPSWYPKKEDPVDGIFFKEQAEALSEYVEVAVLNINLLSLKNPLKILAKDATRIYNENELLRFDYNRINWAPKMPNLRSKLYNYHVLNSFEDLLEHFGEPDIIHAHVSYPAGYQALILSRKFNIPFMVTEHATFFEDILMETYKDYTTKVLEEADFYTAVSSPLKNKILAAGRKQCKTIPNFIHTGKFNIDVSSKNWPYSDKFNFINVSGMRRKKGIDNLLKAVHKLVFDYEFTDLHLHLIGKGSKKRKYEQMSKKLNLNKFCTFYGQLSNKKVAQYMNLSDALVISSRIETFGVVGIEAMASGLPVLATICGGPEDYVNEDNGLLVKKEDVDDLVEGMIKIMNNYSKFNSDKIREYVQENYSKQAVCRKLIDIYKALI